MIGIYVCRLNNHYFKDCGILNEWKETALSNFNSKNANAQLSVQVRCVISSISETPVSYIQKISTPVWEEERGFDQLEIAVCFLTRTHQIADFIELISTEIPIDVYSATQDSMKQMQRALVSTYDINNLNASSFLTATSKHVQLNSEKVSDRPEEIQFFRYFYNLDSILIDPRIVQKPTFFSFYLRLP